MKIAGLFSLKSVCYHLSMGMEKLWTKSRADRLTDPDIQRDLDAEWIRVRESFGRLGDQTKETCTAIVYHSLVRPFVSIKHKKKSEFAPAKQLIAGSVDSTGKTVALVGRVLLASGRATKYGIRRSLVI